MDKDQISRHNKIIEDYVNGKVKLKGEHPDDVMKAIDSFFHAGKMMVDVPELEQIPMEYVTNLITTMSKYPQYIGLVLELIQILKQNESIGTKFIRTEPSEKN